MAEPATVLRYKSEDDKVAALTALQEKVDLGPADLEEIDRITNAEIDAGAGSDEDLPPPRAEQEPAKASGTAAANARNWSIREDDIPKETYVDEDGRERPFITQKDPKELFESYINSQKYIKWFKEEKLRKEREAGIAYAKNEYEPKIQDLQKKIQELESRAAAAATPAAAAKIDAAQRKADDELDRLGKELDDLDISGAADSDQLAKFKDTFKVLTGRLAQVTTELESVKSRPASDSNISVEVQRIRDELKAEKDREQAEQDRKKRISEWDETCASMDRFFAGKDVPAEFKSDRSFKEMTEEAIKFHAALAELDTGRHEADLQPIDLELASIKYLQGDPALAEKVKRYGIQKPRDYDTWVLRDQVEAVRSGSIRDPQTKQWKKKYDPDTGKPVSFNDIGKAFSYWMDATGTRAKLEEDRKKKSAQSVLGAIERRDLGIVQLDTSKAFRDSEGEMSDEKAAEILNDLDTEYVVKQYRKGNKAPLEIVNKALVAVGSAPLDVKDFV